MSAVLPLLFAALPAIAAPTSVLDGVSGPPPRVAVQLSLAEHARSALQATPRLARNDCSGLVMSLLDAAGVDRPGDVRSFFGEAVAEGRVYEDAPPAPGDLVFFDHTYDANKNRRVDDALSHIAVIASVEPDGTLVLVHKGGAGVAALRMNLDEPDVYERDGRVLNDYLRTPGYGPKDGPRLSGQLFRAFAKPPMPPGVDGGPRPSGEPIAHAPWPENDNHRRWLPGNVARPTL